MRRHSVLAMINDLVPPMLDGAKENVEEIGLSRDYFKGTMFAADSGYHSKSEYPEVHG